MKIKLLAIILSGLLAAALAGCGTDNTAAESSLEPTPSITPEPTVTSDPDDIDILSKEFCVLYQRTSAPNSAGGVDVEITFWDFERPIKYATFQFTPYNRVNEPVSCEINRKSTVDLKVTGPSGTDSYSKATFENVWYNSTIIYAVLNSVEIEFMDGTVLKTSATDSLVINKFGLDKSTGKPIIYFEDLRNAINKSLENSEMSVEEFIEKYGELHPDYAINYAEAIFSEDTVLTNLGLIMVVPDMPNILGISTLEFLKLL